MKLVLVISLLSWLVFAIIAEEYDAPLDEADLRLFVEDMDSEGMEYENSAFELEDITSYGLQPMTRAMIDDAEIMGKPLKCGRKIGGKAFAKSTRNSPIHFKTPNLLRGKYPKKVNCKTILEVPKGTKLFMNIHFMDIDTKRKEVGKGKCKDFLRIKAGKKAKFYCGKIDKGKGKIKEMGPWGKDRRILISFRSNNDEYLNEGALLFFYADTDTDMFADGFMTDGPYGGVGGNPFNDQAVSIHGNITAMKIRYSSGIDAIQVRYGHQWGPIHGGTSGTLTQSSFHSAIDTITGSYGKFIDQLKFQTSDDTTFGPFGDTIGKKPIDSSNSGCRLMYISGRSGAKLDAITLHYKC